MTFLLIMIGIYLLGKILDKFTDILALGFVNNFAGALFGGGKVVLILAVALLFFENANASFNFVENNVIEKSQLYDYLKQTSEVVFPYFEELKKNTIN